MADDVRITNFPESTARERVAFDLYREVFNAEGKTLGVAEGNARRPDRKYILDLYAECLAATRGLR
jgi:hypothetical protein